MSVRESVSTGSADAMRSRNMRALAFIDKPLCSNDLCRRGVLLVSANSSENPSFCPLVLTTQPVLVD